MNLSYLTILVFVLIIAGVIYMKKKKSKSLFSGISSNRPKISLNQNKLIEISDRIDR